MKRNKAEGRGRGGRVAGAAAAGRRLQEALDAGKGETGGASGLARPNPANPAGERAAVEVAAGLREMQRLFLSLHEVVAGLEAGLGEGRGTSASAGASERQEAAAAGTGSEERPPPAETQRGQGGGGVEAGAGAGSEEGARGVGGAGAAAEPRDGRGRGESGSGGPGVAGEGGGGSGESALERGRAACAAQLRAVEQVTALFQAQQENSEALLRAVVQAAGNLERLAAQVQGLEERLVQAQRSAYTP